MKDLTNYYVVQNSKSYKYIGTIYSGSTSEYESVDDALKLPEKETAFTIRRYLEWRENSTYKVIQFKTTSEEVEE